MDYNREELLSFLQTKLKETLEQRALAEWDYYVFSSFVPSGNDNGDLAKKQAQVSDTRDKIMIRLRKLRDIIKDVEDGSLTF